MKSITAARIPVFVNNVGKSFVGLLAFTERSKPHWRKTVFVLALWESLLYVGFLEKCGNYFYAKSCLKYMKDVTQEKSPVTVSNRINPSVLPDPGEDTQKFTLQKNLTCVCVCSVEKPFLFPVPSKYIKIVAIVRKPSYLGSHGKPSFITHPFTYMRRPSVVTLNEEFSKASFTLIALTRPWEKHLYMKNPKMCGHLLVQFTDKEHGIEC